MKRVIVFSLIASLFLLSGRAAARASQEDEAKIKNYKDKTVYLRKTLNSNRRVYVSINDKEYFYTHKKTNLFPVKVEEKVTISDVDLESEKVKVRFKSEALGDGEIVFEWPEKTEVTASDFQKLFSEAFAADEKDVLKPLYIGNTSSKILYTRGSNHLPPKEMRKEFNALEEALAEGYRKSSIDFMTLPDVEDYILERHLGRECSAIVREYWPVAIDAALHERVNKIGQRVLSKWVSPLKGYIYKFNAIQADEPNAVACPGGDIFMTTGLLDNTDSDQEIEAVLAHELAHVEKRHGLYQFQEAQRAAVVAGLFSAFIAGAASVRAQQAQVQTISDLARFLANVMREIVLAGYSQEKEEEADSFANIYAGMNYAENGIEKFAYALKKIKFYKETLGDLKIGNRLFSSHPALEDRIYRAQNVRINKALNLPEFAGIDKKGNVVATIRFPFISAIMNKSPEQAIDAENFESIVNPYASAPQTSGPFSYKGNYYLAASLKTTSFLGGKSRPGSLNIILSGERIGLENIDDSHIYPNSEVGMIFKKGFEKEISLENIVGIELDLKNVEKWVIKK